MSEQPKPQEDERRTDQTRFDDAEMTQIDLHRYNTVPNYDIKAVEHGREVFGRTAVKEVAPLGPVERIGQQLTVLAEVREAAKRNGYIVSPDERRAA